MDSDNVHDSEMEIDVTPLDSDKMDLDKQLGFTESKDNDESTNDIASPAPTGSVSKKRKSKRPPHSANPAALAVGAAGVPDEPDTGSASSTGNTTNASTPNAEANKPKRGGSKPILKVSGIGRVDNNLKPTTFLSTPQINQKNYYTNYLRRDDQVMFYRDWNEEQKRQKDAKSDVIEDEARDLELDFVPGSKTIVVHMGSQNLRVGKASDAYPKVSPNVIAHRRPFIAQSESGDSTNKDSAKDTLPQIPPMDPEFEEMLLNYNTKSDKNVQKPDSYLMFGKEFKEAHATACKDFRERMRFYKRRVVPSSHEIVVSFNQRAIHKPERIPDLNDPNRIEWAHPETEKWPLSYTGADAFKIVSELMTPNPKYPYYYQLKYPICHGGLNETDYETPQELLGDISYILVNAFEKDLHVTFKQYSEYNVVFIVPDIYTKSYVDSIVALTLQMGFSGVSIMQESMAATFGAGVSTACVIDIGAQTSTIACVEEGMIIPDSRVNLKFGGADISLALAKLLLMSSFPYPDLNLARAYDFNLIEELKQQHVTTNDADITVQLYSFIKRAPGKPAEKYQFKVFEEVMLAPLGLFYPEMFQQDIKQARWAQKQKKEFKSSFGDYEDTFVSKTTTVPAKFSLFPKSFDIYDGTPNDPESASQYAIAREKPTVHNMPTIEPKETKDQENVEEKPVEPDLPDDPLLYKLTGLDHAIIESIAQAGLSKMQTSGQLPGAAPLPNSTPATTNGTLSPAKLLSLLAEAEKPFYGNLLIVGGGASKLPGFNTLLTDRLEMWLSYAGKPMPSEISVMPAPREMDPQVLSWKGGGVYSKLKIASECWITAKDWDMLGNRALQYKCLFAY